MAATMLWKNSSSCTLRGGIGGQSDEIRNRIDSPSAVVSELREAQIGAPNLSGHKVMDLPAARSHL